MVAGFREGEAETVDIFKESAKQLFGRAEALLKAEGAAFEDVVMMHSYHVWNSPSMKLGKFEQFRAFSDVKDEFMRAPYPAWTAVGVTGLLGSRAIEMIAYVPQDRRPRR